MLLPARLPSSMTGIAFACATNWNRPSSGEQSWTRATVHSWSGRIEVPGQDFYGLAIGLAFIVSVLIVGTSADDLSFGTHHLKTRTGWELGTRQPASIEQHFSVFV
jgi:hypothetical protein